jgi:hypothetical protein
VEELFANLFPVASPREGEDNRVPAGLDSSSHLHEAIDIKTSHIPELGKHHTTFLGINFS